MSGPRTFRLTPPLSEADVSGLAAGDKVLFSGVVYTARDAAHKRLVELLEDGQELPFDPKGAVIYYVGPTPPPPGRPAGAAGPTTAYRMDPYTPQMLAAGAKAFIAKGKRSEEVRQALVKYKGVYLAAVGGAGALIGQSIKKAEVIAFPELGPEAVRRMEVEDFPAIVINDVQGQDQYQMVADKAGTKDR